MVAVISLMLVAFDLIDENSSTNSELQWSGWATLGVWILFISVQLIRYQPYYGWLMVPISGILLSVFIAGIDRYTGENRGVWGLDWSWYVIIPLMTFIVILPIIARLARKQPSHRDRLAYLVDHLEG
jgi:hypothetical protein